MDEEIQQIPPVEQPPQQESKKFPLVLTVVGIVIMVLIAGGVFAYFQFYYIDEPFMDDYAAKVCPDGSVVEREGPDGKFGECPGAKVIVDTSDWKTYRNEEFGYQIQHPPKTGVVEQDVGKKTYFSLVLHDLTQPPPCSGSLCTLTIISSRNPQKLDVEAALQGEEIDINGNLAYKFADEYLFRLLTDVFLIKGDLLIHITYSTDVNTTPVSQLYDDAFSRILSTFKFIELRVEIEVEEDKVPKPRECEVVSDCVLLLCAGPYNKEYAKGLPPDLPCVTYLDYSLACIQNICTAIKN